LKVLARASALAYKATEKSISVIEDLSFEAPKTKDYTGLLNSLSLTNKRTLLVLGEDNKNVFLSSKNVQRANVTTADLVNTYDVLQADNVILCEGSVEKLNNLLTN
jgi:large subunit ribosomal protein L4